MELLTMTFIQRMKQSLSHPNSLTLFRIGTIPAVVVLMLYPNRIFSFLAAVIFSIAAITDYFDGYYARLRGMESNFGKIMDPLADKLLISCAFIMLTAHGWVPAWVVCIIISREIAITGLRNVITEAGGDVAASWLGKYKTGFQIAAIIPLMIHYTYFGVRLHVIGEFFMWGAVVFTVWSGADYFIRHRMLLLG